MSSSEAEQINPGIVHCNCNTLKYNAVIFFAVLLRLSKSILEEERKCNEQSAAASAYLFHLIVIIYF